MILDEFLEVVDPILKEKRDVKAVLQDKSIEQINLVELTQISDQEIDTFIKEKEQDEYIQSILFDIFQKAKIEQSINDLTADVAEAAYENEKKVIESLFSKVLTPKEIQVEENTVCLKYDYADESILKEKVYERERWDSNVIETISKRYNLSADRIALVEDVTGYVRFINEFEENNYVSRGQKDCTYPLKPSLHRLYSDSYATHAISYESAFKQKVLYYDASTEKKNDEELKAYGQHFGLPTNYLDFTEAHLISLLFAVEDYEYDENHSIVFFVDAFSYHKDIIKTEMKLIDFSDSNLKEAKEREYNDKSYFIRVGNSNERIHFQKGCFLKMVPDDTLKEMFEKYGRIAIIDKSCKKSILEELFKLGITFENIYPDKDNMVKTIRFIKENM